MLVEWLVVHPLQTGGCTHKSEPRELYFWRSFCGALKFLLQRSMGSFILVGYNFVQVIPRPPSREPIC
jgi:hypothetical protein